MNTPDKCPHCGADTNALGKWNSVGRCASVWLKQFECGTYESEDPTDVCRERAARIKVDSELAATKRELGAIRRRLSGEETENCPLCAEMRPTGEPQRIPMCHVCTLESSLEATKRELEEMRESRDEANERLAALNEWVGCHAGELNNAKSELAETKRELEEMRGQYDSALRQSGESRTTLCRLRVERDAAEARVRELEGLAVLGTIKKSDEDFLNVAIAIPESRHKYGARTLGEAMGGGK